MDARPSTAPQSATDIAILTGVVVLTVITAIVHLSLLCSPTQCSSSTASAT